MAREREVEQRRIGHERPPRLESTKPGAVIEAGTGMHEHAHETRRPAQAREVRERIGAGRRRQAKPTVQQPVPDLGRDEVVGVSHHLEIVHLAECDVDGQLVEQGRGRVRRIGLRIERVDVADEGSLRMGEIGNHGIRQRETRRGGVGIPGVFGEQVVRGEAQDPQVTPDTGVKFLGVPEQQRGARYRIGVRSEIGDIGNPLFLVDDQILDNVQILGPRLKREMRRGVAVGAAVVHVHVDVAAPPAAGSEIVDAFENDAAGHEAATRYRRVGTKHLVLGTSPHLDVHLPRRDR